MQENNIAQVEAPAVAPWQAPTDPPQRILVVDDDETTRFINAKILAHSGYHVDAVEDGDAAWQALNTDSYDLLVTDHNMPNVSGVELLKKLHATCMTVPVIMATGTLPKEEFTRYPELRPDATLLKPYSVEQLLEAVKEILCTTRTPREQRDLLPV